MRPRCAAPLGVVATLLLLSSCSSKSTNVSFNPTPVITGSAAGVTPTPGLFPDTAVAGGPAFTLKIAGTGFIASSQAQWNGVNLTTTFNAETLQLSVEVPAADIVKPGIALVTVVNPPPGGGTSSAASFVISPANNPVPTIASLSPSSTPVGTIPLNGLAVDGANFVSNSVVALNGSPRATTFVSSKEVIAQLVAADVAANASLNVTVTNPAPGGGTSAAAVFTVGAGAAVSGKFPQIISASANGGAANGTSSAPAMSADGRFVAFHSRARNLVAKGASGNIFVRDTCLGAANCAPRTIAIDLAPDGSAPNANAADQLALSADGRFVAFASYAADLVPGMPQSNASPLANLFLRDLCVGQNAPAGCLPHTDLISEGLNSEPANNSSLSPSLSADGRFVAFVSWAANLVPGTAASEARVFVRDTCAGPSATKSCVAQTYLASLAPSGQVVADSFDHPAISADGRFVAVQMWTRRLGAPEPQYDSRVVLQDTCRGIDAPAVCTPSAISISIAPDGSVLNGVNELPSVSNDGRFVVFESQAADATQRADSSSSLQDSAQESGAPQQIFLRDTCLGITASDGCTPSTTMISGAISGTGESAAFSPWISPSGRFITFIIEPPSLSGPLDAQTAQPAVSRSGLLVVRDTCFGVNTACTPETFTLLNPSPGARSLPLAADKFTPVMLTSGGLFASFFAPNAPAGVESSGLGDVLLTIVRF